MILINENVAFQVVIWNVDSGTLEAKISHSSEDSLTTVCWSPDGTKLACGGAKGNFYQTDAKGVVSDSWEGVRVQCLAYRADSRSVLAADTHNRIRTYAFDNLKDELVIQEEHGVIAFTLDDSDSYALVNLNQQGMHLWDIRSRTLIRKFKGVKNGFYSIHGCFGGPRGAQCYVASGSEDNKIYLYHVTKDDPIAVLSGHTRVVSAVTWNPICPQVLVSCSDDGSIRVWGPSEHYRRRHRMNYAAAKANGEGPSTTNGSANGVS